MVAITTIPRGGAEIEKPHKTRNSTDSIAEKLISYLAAGCSNTEAASALGIEISRVTQFMSDPAFVEALSQKKVGASMKYIERDTSWDSAEDKLLDKLHSSIPLMHKPQDILRALQIVNGAKRRASTAPDMAVKTNNVVQLILPSTISNKFIRNAQNQVVQTGEQSLLTIQTGSLASLAAATLQKVMNNEFQSEATVIEAG